MAYLNGRPAVLKSIAVGRIRLGGKQTNKAPASFSKAVSAIDTLDCLFMA
jgi:hypothetical protein